MLEVRDLVKHFRVGDGKPIRAVDGVSFAVAPGELFALYGRSGSGKSTLLDLIAGFQLADSGTVRIAGQAVGALSEKQHAKMLLDTIGIVGQPEDLMPEATAAENAALKLLRTDPRHATSRIEPLLIELGLGDRLRHRVSKLSMGERQRVLIAQALSRDPRLLLADEPTAHLDSHRSEDTLSLLREQCRTRNLAVLLATHDPQATRFADRSLELLDGHLHDRLTERSRSDSLYAEHS